jgi:putative ABC transport system permease protein
MFDLDRIQEIWITITRNKVRSFLTAFGVFWGIFTLVVMTGAGNGLERGVMKGVVGFSTNSCFMGSAPTSIPYKGLQKGRTWNIRNKDINILSDSVPEIEHLSPIIWGETADNNVVYKNHATTFQVRGSYPNYVQIERQRIPYGRFINNIDILKNRKVCIIGTKVYEDLFPTGENPIDRYIRISGVYYRIVGVTEGVSNVNIGGRLENSVLIPFTTLQQINNQGDIIHFLAVTSKENIPVKKVEERIKKVLKESNKIHPEDLRAVWSFNMEQEYNLYMNLFKGVSFLIWIIGSGTLIAGSVGVCNIMLVTVRERTKEIGIRRALGAKPGVIIGQIICESFVLTGISGIAGLCAGIYALYLSDIFWLQKQDNVFILQPMITFKLAVISIFILLTSGLLAGIIPASRALRIKAIDAIREE